MFLGLDHFFSQFLFFRGVEKNAREARRHEYDTRLTLVGQKNSVRELAFAYTGKKEKKLANVILCWRRLRTHFTNNKITTRLDHDGSGINGRL